MRSPLHGETFDFEQKTTLSSASFMKLLSLTINIFMKLLYLTISLTTFLIELNKVQGASIFILANTFKINPGINHCEILRAFN